MVRAGGGSDDTEQAIALAIEWFKRNQESDGRWSLEKHGGARGHDNAATSFAMLCFFGWNIKHTEPDKQDYHQVMAKAVGWLLGRMGKDGDLTGGADNGMYDQGIATMALAEAYGLTKDPALREPLKRATDFILRAQSEKLGGWRYRPGSRDNDTSVFGWEVMALSSARLAGIEVSDRAFQLAGAWLDQVASGPHKGRYSYQPGREASPTMTAEGMFCQQLMGVSPTDDRQGDDAGAWPDTGQWTKGKGGKIMATAMSALSLEVYYRYLPMYTLPERPPGASRDAKK